MLKRIIRALILVGGLCGSGAWPTPHAVGRADAAPICPAATHARVPSGVTLVLIVARTGSSSPEDAGAARLCLLTAVGMFQPLYRQLPTSDIAMSADRRVLAYRDTTYRIHVVRLPGGVDSVIGRGVMPRFSHDGRYLAFVTSDTLPAPASGAGGEIGAAVGAFWINDAAASIQPSEPGALALGPHGDLYIADRARNQILKRLAAGTFVVIAGNGRAGFSGDGGPAVEAELHDPGGMTITRDGTIYVSDSQNRRIRRISPGGIITTIAGDGKPGLVTSATPALGATLGDPADVIVGPHGDLYIADAGSDQVLRLSAAGMLMRVAGSNIRRYAGIYGVGKPATEASPDGPYGLAFDRSGDLYIAGINTKTLLMINAKGIMTLPMGEDGFYPRGVGGVKTAPDGSVLAMNNLRVVRLTPKGERTVFDFSGKHILGPSGAFLPNGFAVGSNGAIYTDTDRGNGFSNTAAVAEIVPGGQVRVLWRAV